MSRPIQCQSGRSLHCRDQSPTIPSKMVKVLPHSTRVQNTVELLSAPPKRKREDSIDEISAFRHQESDNDNNDEHFVFPLHKRSLASTHALSAFCTASYDSERRDGPAEDDVHDEETEALVKKFRTSIFRQDHRRVEPPSPSTSSATTLSSRPWSPAAKEDDEGSDLFDVPSIQRATTISDDSSDLSCCSCDPPEISSRPTSPGEFREELDQHQHHDQTLEYCCQEEEDPILEARRELPLWRPSPSYSASPSQPSPLWNSEKRCSFWAEDWTGTFHQGSG